MMALRRDLMKSDVREKKDSYLLEVDLPGCHKEDIKAYVENGYLHIAASMNKEKSEGHGKFLRKECYSGQYERSFYLGDDVDPEGICGSYKHGVLKVTIPKVDSKKVEAKNRIAIQ